MVESKVFSPSNPSRNVFVELIGVTKVFPGVVALDNVNLQVYHNTIHALLGENGSGKSTLVKILYGIYTLDEGEIRVNGVKVYITSPKDAVKHGIVMVSQSPVLIDRLTIAENIILGLKEYGLLSSTRKVYDKIMDVFRKLNINLDPNIEVYKLTYTQKQMVEIARAVMLNAKLLILDEATSYLPDVDKQRVFKFLREFTASEGSVILITHKIREALEISDVITILRSGRVVATVERLNADEDLIRKHMFGEYVLTERKIGQSALPGEIVLSIRDLWVKGDLGEYKVRGVNLDVYRGEIMGVAGITGSGQSELLEAIMGLRRIDKGTILINGVNVTNKNPGFIRRLGVGYIPDNPLKQGVSIEHSIVENLAVTPFNQGFIVKWSEISKLAEELIKKYNILTPSINSPVKLLSGGNVMKTIISREFEYASTILLAYNPTRCLDEYSAENFRRLILEKARAIGLSVLYVSEDLDEVLDISDRVAVMNTGRITGVFNKSSVDRSVIEKYMVS